MAYFRTYTLEFTDRHADPTQRAKWRADILDDQANASVIPKTLTPSYDALQFERVDTSDNKNGKIIGSQLTLLYEYTGAASDPLPELFFDTDERRFKIEIYKNDQLYGVYYVNPSTCDYDYKYPPFTVSLTAVDGMAFTKSMEWNAYKDDGALDYRIMSLYEIMLERGLSLAFDFDLEVNVVNTLRPANAGGSKSFLNDLYLHSDNFIDFSVGPLKIHDMLTKIVHDHNLILYVDAMKIWIVRVPDLLKPVVQAENYKNGVLSTLTLSTIKRTIGPSLSGNSATYVDANGGIVNVAAIKQNNFELKYRSINVIANFDWRSYADFGAGFQFEFWPGIVSPEIQQHGTGTQDDPFTAFLQYNAGDPGNDSMINFYGGVFDPNSAHPGDIIEFSTKYKWKNTGKFKMLIVLAGATPGERLYLNSSGDWSDTIVEYIGFSRSGKRENGSINIKSAPIPDRIGSTILSGNLQLQTSIYTPTDLNTYDPTMDQGVEIYPIKIGIIPGSSNGSTIIDTNTGRYSRIIPKENFYFIDTGDASLANTTFVDTAGTPAADWSSAQFPADIKPIEQHMADSYIDQYGHPVRSFQGNLYSNSIGFWNIFTLSGIADKIFMQLSDKFSALRCTHTVNMQEILPENATTTKLQEFDIEDIRT